MNAYRPWDDLHEAESAEIKRQYPGLWWSRYWWRPGRFGWEFTAASTGIALLRARRRRVDTTGGTRQCPEIPTEYPNVRSR